MPEALPDRIRSRLVQAPNDTCWVWTGRMSRNGYGRIFWNGKERAAHRVIYEIVVGPIQEGMVLDHLCRNRPCCNPDHLEQVSVQVNTHRGEAVLFKRVCDDGHL